MSDYEGFGSPNPHRLYRNPERGVILGVCAGLADYFGLKNWQMRALAVLALVIFPPQAVLAYLVTGVVLKRRPPVLYRTPDEEVFWRSVSRRPNDTFSALRHKFRSLEQRLADLERQVTSDEFTLHRAFRDLERGGPETGERR